MGAGAKTPAPDPPRGRWLAPADDDTGTGIVAVLFVVLIVRFWGLGWQSVSTREAIVWTAARLPFHALIEFCARRHAGPPLFHLLTGWALRVGDDETRLRLLPVLASAALVWVTYRLARLGADRRTSTIAAALLALSPGQILHAQDASPASLAALWTALALLLFARAVLFERDHAWRPFVLVSTLGWWTPGAFWLGVGVQTAVILITPAGRRRLKPWLIATAAAAASVVPWLVLSRLGSAPGPGHASVTVVTRHDAFHLLRAVFLSPIPLVTPLPTAHLPGLERFVPRPLAWGLLVLAALVPLAMALRGGLEPSARGRVTRFAFTALALSLTAVLVTPMRGPTGLARDVVFLGPMVALLSAYGVTALKPRGLSMAWLALLLVVSGYGTLRYFTDYSKEPWREVVRHIADTSDPDSTAVIVTLDPGPFVYYSSRLPRPLHVYAAARPEAPFQDPTTREQIQWIGRTLADSTARFSEVWLVTRNPDSRMQRWVALIAQVTALHGRERMEEDSLVSVGGPVRWSRFRDRTDALSRLVQRQRMGLPLTPQTDAPLPTELMRRHAAEIKALIRKLQDRSLVEFQVTDEVDTNPWYPIPERLGQLGAAAVPALIERLDTRDAFERMQVIYALLIATQDSEVMARTGDHYFNPVGTVLDSDAAIAQVEQARRWWAKYGYVWRGVYEFAPAADTLRVLPR
ncbi:MAG: glycosyltransferase family 39 protein [Candidatus Eisenbacteria bacterium]